MRKINSLQRRLEWVQPGALKMYYELRSDNELIATLGFRSLLGSFATAESADGCWTFKRIGFLQTRATIRACGSDAEIATFKNNTWSGGGTLTLADGREFLVTTNVWQTQLEIQTAAGEVLVHLQTSVVSKNWLDHSFLLFSGPRERAARLNLLQSLPTTRELLDDGIHCGSP
jgi:hypothetical protein